MVERTSADSSLIAFALTRVPDLPRWIDTRGMLLSGRAVVHSQSAPDEATSGFIVVVADSALASIVGRPADEEVAGQLTRLSGDVNVLAQMEDADAVGRALGRWRRQRAIIQVLPDRTAWEQDVDPNARVFTLGRDAFAADLDKTRKAIEDAAGLLRAPAAVGS